MNAEQVSGSWQVTSDSAHCDNEAHRTAIREFWIIAVVFSPLSEFLKVAGGFYVPPQQASVLTLMLEERENQLDEVKNENWAEAEGRGGR